MGGSTNLRQFLKQLAQGRGWLAVIEEPILDGAGRVDVSLTMGEIRIACEVSVTSTCDQELGNIEKCFEAEFDQVIVVAPKRQHLNTLRKFVIPHLDPDICDKVHFILLEAVLDCLDELTPPQADTEETVRGYKVSTTYQALSKKEAQQRRLAIATIVGRSLNQLKERDGPA